MVGRVEGGMRGGVWGVVRVRTGLRWGMWEVGCGM